MGDTGGWHRVYPYTIKIHEAIGEGGGGRVYLAKNDNDETVAAKKVLKKTCRKPKRLMDLYLNICSGDYEHHNMVKIFNLKTENNDSFWLFMELCEFGDLDRIYKNHTTYFTQDQKIQKVQLVRQIAQGLKYLHGFGLVHRDIKPKNIIAKGTPEGEVILKIADFGLSRCIRLEDDPNAKLDTVVGTRAFRAPEYFSKKVSTDIRCGTTRLENPADKCVDIFSFGITVLSLWQVGIHEDNVPVNLLPNVAKAKLNEDEGPEIGKVINERKNEDIMQQLVTKDDDEEDILADLILGTIKYNGKDRWTAENIIKYFEKQEVSTIYTFDNIVGYSGKIYPRSFPCFNKITEILSYKLFNNSSNQ